MSHDCISDIHEKPEAATLHGTFTAPNPANNSATTWYCDLCAVIGMGVGMFTPDSGQSCPTRLLDGRNEIRCWLDAGHEGKCK